MDEANILPSPEEAQLEIRLREFLRNEKTAIVVATIPSLDGRPIESAAFDTFNEWRIGDGKTMRGLLILVAPADRQVRIEVGCGLESVVTNQAAKEIIETRMIPLFKSKDFTAAVNAGVDGLIEKVADSEDAGPVSKICVEAMKKAA